MQHRVLEYYQVCSYDNLFYSKVKFGPLRFCMGKKVKQLFFSETIAVYDLKLATDDRSDKKFLLTSKFCLLGAVCPLPGAIFMH